MRKPMPYESFLYDLVDDYAVNEGLQKRMPIWLVNAMRAYRWMVKLYRAMGPWNGYTVSKQLRLRMEHAPETRFRRCQEMPDEMREMLDEYCGILQILNEQLFSHFESNKTIVLKNREDRQKWDDALEKLHLLLNSQPSERRYEASVCTESIAIATIPQFRMWE